MCTELRLSQNDFMLLIQVGSALCLILGNPRTQNNVYFSGQCSSYLSWMPADLNEQIQCIFSSLLNWHTHPHCSNLQQDAQGLLSQCLKDLPDSPSHRNYFFKDFFVNNCISFNIPLTHLFAFWRTPNRPLSEVSFWNTSGKLDRSCQTSLRCCTREEKDSTWESPWNTLFWLAGSLDIFRSQTTEKRKWCFSIWSCVAYCLWKVFSKLYFYIHNCFSNLHLLLFHGKAVTISQHHWLFPHLEFHLLAYLKFDWQNYVGIKHFKYSEMKVISLKPS